MAIQIFTSLEKLIFEATSFKLALIRFTSFYSFPANCSTSHIKYLRIFFTLLALKWILSFRKVIPLRLPQSILGKIKTFEAEDKKITPELTPKPSRTSPSVTWKSTTGISTNTVIFRFFRYTFFLTVLRN